jgi:hypothetical protein
MKVNKLIRRMYKAILKGNKAKEKRLWIKSLRKSIKHKHTEAVQ